MGRYFGKSLKTIEPFLIFGTETEDLLTILSIKSPKKCFDAKKKESVKFQSNTIQFFRYILKNSCANELKWNFILREKKILLLKKCFYAKKKDSVKFQSNTIQFFRYMLK